MPIDLHEGILDAEFTEIEIRPLGESYVRDDGTRITLSDDNCIWAPSGEIWFTRVGWDRYLAKRDRKLLDEMN